MKRNYAVFYRNHDGDLAQLTNWIGLDRAKELMDNKVYFSDRKKVLLMRVDDT